jgi:putative membrane protein
MHVLNKDKKLPDESVKYAQQHLANERTYLAWIRTAISIVGVGFLTTSLHFTIGSNRNHFIDSLAIILGIFACIIGITTGILSTIQYSRKRREIQEGIYIPSNRSIIFISTLFTIMIFLIFTYLSFILFML